MIEYDELNESVNELKEQLSELAQKLDELEDSIESTVESAVEDAVEGAVSDAVEDALGDVSFNAPAAGTTLTTIRIIRTPLKENIIARFPANFSMESAARRPSVYFSFPPSGRTEILLSVGGFNTSSSVISRRISLETYLNGFLFFS